MHEQLFENYAAGGQEKLDGIDMTVEYVVGQLYDACKEFRSRFDREVKIREWESKDLSGSGLGFTSKIARLTVHFTNPSSSPSFSMVLKVLSPENIFDLWATGSGSDTLDTKEDAKKTLEALARTHNTECDFYTMFGDKGVVPLARCFIAQKMEGRQPGIIALEDLSQTARVNRLEENLSAKRVGLFCSTRIYILLDTHPFLFYPDPRSKY